MRHEAYVLKQLQGLAMWQGDIVHDGIRIFVQPYLKSRSKPDTNRIVAVTLDMAREQFSFSLQREYRKPGMTKESAGLRYAALYAHEYGQEINDDQLQQVLDTVRSALKVLLGLTELIEEICISYSVYVEQNFPFQLDGTTISPKLDLMFLNGRGRPVIVDWKTTTALTNDYSRQLMVYALAVRHWWKAMNPDDITVKEINLLEGTTTTYPVNAQTLIEIEDFIYRSVAQIRDLVGDRKWENQNLEDFEPAKSYRTCLYCNFRRLCQEVYRDLPSAESVQDQESKGTQLQLSLF